MNIFSPSTLLSKYFKMTYVETCEFSEHVAWSLVFGLAGIVLHWIIIPIWIIYSLLDEFYQDGHYIIFFGVDPKWKDLLWDLGSKIIPCLIIGIICLIK